MNWGRRLEALRDRLPDDPSGVLAELVQELGKGGESRFRPTERVRLHSLLVAAHRDLGDLAASLSALAAGQRLGGSAVAQVELLVVGAGVHVENGDAQAARRILGSALVLVEKELGRPPGSSHSARARRRWLIDLKASCLTIRSEVALRLEDDSRAAMIDVLDALALTQERSDQRVRMAGFSRLAAVLIQFGSLNDVTRALELVDQADRTLARRRVRRSHLHRVLMRWVKALALARLGSVDRAENIMLDVIEHLGQKGQAERLKHAVDALAWIVGERAGRPDRAAYLRRKYAR